MAVCIIPARGGSKRIPRKNIRSFIDRPLIAYSIEAARNSGVFDRVILSTDDLEIAEVARRYGAEVPFMRPAELADDHANTFDLMAHAADWVRAQHRDCEYLCCLYATAPFVRARDLKAGLDKLMSSPEANYAYSITEHGFPVQRSVRLLTGDHVQPWMPENMLKRSQDLESLYHDAGQFYWGKVDAFAEKTDFFGPTSLGVVLPRYRVVDIDTEADWTMAEVQYRTLQKMNLD